MKAQTDSVRKQLANLAGLADRTERVERRILEQAEKRLAAVQSELERARPGIEAAPDDAQDRYTDLVAERGQLHMVIAKAREAIRS